MAGMTEFGIRLRLDGASQVQAGAAQAGQAVQALSTSTKAFGQGAQLTGQQSAQMSAQLQDLFVQIQAGGSPLTALIQQGSQLSAVFGGSGNALRAVASLITPATAAIAAAGAAVGTLAAAFLQGDKERMAFLRGMVTTGNAAGVTASQLGELSKAVAGFGASRGQGADVLAQLVQSGKVAAGVLGTATEAAIRLERDGGVAIKDTVAVFADIGKAPVDAVKKLNESQNFLTAATYKQIAALQDQGRASEAARVAQEAYAAASTSSMKTLESQLGMVETAWRAMGKGAKGAWDAVLNVGRADTTLERFEATRKGIQNILDSTGGKEPSPGNASALMIAGLRTRLEMQRLQLLQEGELAQAMADQAEQTTKSIKKIDDLRDAAKKAGEEFKKLAEAGKALSFGEEMKAAGFDAGFGKQIEEVSAALKAKALTGEEVRLVMERLIAQQPRSVAAHKREADALKELDDALEASAKARMDAFVRSDKATDDADKRVAALQKETTALQDQLTQERGGKAIKEQMIALRLEEQILIAQAEASAAAGDGQSAVRVAWLNAEVDLLRQQLAIHRELAGVIAAKEVAKENERAARDLQRTWERITDSISDSLADAIMNGGKDGAKALEALFKRLVLRPLVQYGVNQVIGWATGQDGTAGGSSTGLMQGANTLGSMYSAGSKAYGMYTGSTAATTYSQYVAGYQGSSAMMGSATVGPVTNGAAGATGAGASTASAVSTMGPYAIAAIAYAIGADQMADWSLHLGGYSEARKGSVRDIAADLGNTNSAYEPMQQASDKMAAALFEFTDKFAASVKAKSPIEAAQVVFESDQANDSWGQVKFLGGGNREVGSTGMLTDLNWHPDVAAPQLVARSAGAFATAMQESDAADWVKASLAKIPAELERITPEITKQFEDPLKQAQALNQAMVGMLDGISAQFAQLDQLDEQLGALGGAFATIATASSDTRNTLVSMFGGMEQFQAQIGAYVGAYYTEAERAALTTKQLGDTLGAVGLTLPKTREGFRELVNAQELTTEAGRKNFAVLMSTAGAFASITEEGRSAADILSERTGLEQQLLEVQGNTVELRRREREAIDPTNRALYDQIKAQEDLRTASDKLLKVLEDARDAAIALDEFKGAFASLDFEAIGDELIKQVALGMGGFGNLSGSVGAYFDEFMTEADRMGNGAANIAAKLKLVGIEVPNTVAGLQTLGRDGFKALVQAAVGSGSAGALGALLGVSGAFADLVPSADDAAEALQKVVDTLKDAVTEAMAVLVRTVNVSKEAAKTLLTQQEAGFDARETTARGTHDSTIARIEAERKAFGDNGTGALQDKISAEQLSEMYRRRKVEDDVFALQAKITEAAEAFKKAMDAVTDKIKTSADEVNRLTALSGALRGTIDAMRPIGSEAFDRQQAQAQIRDVLATARETGALPKAEDLRRSLSVVAQPSDQLFATQVDYLRDFNKTLNDVTALSDITDGQLDVATQQLTALEAIRDLMERSQFASGPEADGLKSQLGDALEEYGKLTGESLGDALDLFSGFEVKANQDLVDKIETDDAAMSKASQRRIEDWNIELDTKQQQLKDFLDGLTLRKDAADTTLDGLLDGIAKDREAAKLAYETEIGRLDKIIEANQKLVDEALGLNKTATSIEAAINSLKEKLAALDAVAKLPTTLDALTTAINALPAGIASAVASALAGINFNQPTVLPVPRVIVPDPVQPPPVLPGDGPAIVPAVPVVPVIPNPPIIPGDTSGFRETLLGFLGAEQYDLFRSRALSNPDTNTLDKARAFLGYLPGYNWAYELANGLQSFAGGTNYVPNNMVAQIHEGERIVPAADNAQLMRMLRSPERANDALVAEVKALRQQVAELQTALVVVASNTGQAARTLRDFDTAGMPDVRA